MQKESRESLILQYDGDKFIGDIFMHKIQTLVYLELGESYGISRPSYLGWGPA